MTKYLCNVSWKPLCEADKTAQQVVRKCGDLSVYIASHLTYSDGECWLSGWAVDGRSIYLDENDCEFLCIEPVEQEPIKKVWVVYRDGNEDPLGIYSSEEKAGLALDEFMEEYMAFEVWHEEVEVQ